MTDDQGSRAAQRTRADREELAERIAAALPHDGTAEPQPGLHLRRHSRPGARVYGSYPPAFCVVAQGSKDVLLGEETFRYNPAHYLISTMELPLAGDVVEASPERPYLNLRLVLDPSVVTSVMAESGYVQPQGHSSVRAIDVSPLSVDLLDATLRLVRLLDTPGDYCVLAPLIVREIIYRLLADAQGSRLSHLAKLGGHIHRMARAVQAIRQNFDRALRVEDLAQEVNMSVSGFHSHFKSVTATTPLQFQKELRLQEARRLMLNEDLGATEAGFRVGYEDASHFSREYKRYFGKPPKQDIEHLRMFARAGELP